MNKQSIQLLIGLNAITSAVFLYGIIIPSWVSTPSNMNSAILSPALWPQVISILIGVVGVGLCCTCLRAEDTQQEVQELSKTTYSLLRMASLAVVMVIGLAVFDILGMLTTTVLIFLVTSALVKTNHPIIAVLCALFVPLGLYLFFSKVAGIGFPEGYLRGLL